MVVCEGSFPLDHPKSGALQEKQVVPYVVSLTIKGGSEEAMINLRRKLFHFPVEPGNSKAKRK